MTRSIQFQINKVLVRRRQPKTYIISFVCFGTIRGSDYYHIHMKNTVKHWNFNFSFGNKSKIFILILWEGYQPHFRNFNDVSFITIFCKLAVITSLPCVISYGSSRQKLTKLSTSFFLKKANGQIKETSHTEKLENEIWAEKHPFFLVSSYLSRASRRAMYILLRHDMIHFKRKKVELNCCCLWLAYGSFRLRNREKSAFLCSKISLKSINNVPT